MSAAIGHAEHYGRGLEGRPNMPVVYGDHGNSTRWHRPERVGLLWCRGVLDRVVVRAVCGARLYRPRLAESPPAGLTPCVRCHFHLSVVPTEVPA